MIIDFEKINTAIEELINLGLVNPKIGTAQRAIYIKIESMNEHAGKHGITIEQAQNFINNSEIMFNQGNRSMYLSFDGSATVIIENRRLISAYGKKDFDTGIRAILEVIENA